MSAIDKVSIVVENLTVGARAVAPGEGRLPAVEVDAEGVRTWLEAFAALPAPETEEADARINLITPRRRLLVRHASERLIMEEGDTFASATVDEIVARLFAPSDQSCAATDTAEADNLTPAVPRRGGKLWALVVLLALLPVLGWWTGQSDTPEGIEWVRDAGERQAILFAARGSYATDDERLTVDGASGSLVVAAHTGEEIIRTSLRVGRRGDVPVLMTEGGVLLEFAADNTLHLGDTVYHRVP